MSIWVVSVDRIIELGTILNQEKMKNEMLFYDLQVRLSNITSVILRSVDLDTEGMFKCEVSAEWPDYYTESRSSFMEVVGRWCYSIYIYCCCCFLF